MQETPVRYLGWEHPQWDGHGNPLQYSCLENPHGERSLVGCSPWGCKEWDRLPTPVLLGLPGGSVGKESACNAGEVS